jgi:hypothetical protein
MSSFTKGIKRGDNVKITSYSPPIEGVVTDTYEVNKKAIVDQRIRSFYKDKVPMIEISLDGKTMVFAEMVVERT